MARPQVADGGTASNMEGSRGQPIRGDPPAWGLGEVLTTPHSKNVSCKGPYTL
jgi:hypothetical protein